MKTLLMTLAIFSAMVGIGRSDENIYGPGGVNLGPSGNPYAENTPPNVQSVKSERRLDDPTISVKNSNPSQSLDWNENRWSNSGDVEQDKLLEARRNDRNLKRWKEELAERHGISATSQPDQYQEQSPGISVNIQPNNHGRTGTSGAIDTRTGEYFAPAGGGGYIDTGDGRFYAPAGPNGVIDSQTGQFIPITGGANQTRSNENRIQIQYPTQRKYIDPTSRLNGNRFVPWH